MFSLICGKFWLTDDKRFLYEVKLLLFGFVFFSFENIQEFSLALTKGGKLRFSSHTLFAVLWLYNKEMIAGAARVPKARGSHQR